MNKLIIVFLLLFVGFVNDVCAKRKSKKQVEEVKKDSLTSYDKLFEGKKVTSCDGLMKIHDVNGKVYVEFPLDYLNKEFLYTTSIESISDNGEGFAGQFCDGGTVFIFTREDTCIYARQVVLSEVMNNTGVESVKEAFSKSKMPGVFKTMKIEAYTPDSSAVVLDMTKFFIEHIEYTSPFPAFAGNSMLGFVTRKHKLDELKSLVGTVKGYANTIMAQCSLHYNVDYYMMGNLQRRDVVMNAVVNKMLSFLPEKEMQVRYADSRIGVAFEHKTGYGEVFQGLESLYLAKRWRVEPKDARRYFNGEAVEVVKPIVFYMDTLMPEAWKKYIAEAGSEWNRAFEEIGFLNALRVEKYPREEGFNANNIEYSTIKYAPQWQYSAQVSVITDPRTGEILNASIYLPNNFTSILQRGRILATMNSDPAIRRTQLSDEQTGKLVKASVMQQMGLCLGLIPNLIASSAYPVDSLRSASFTGKYGLAASVIDNLEYNFIAQPEDVEKGVLLEPERIGPYDFYAIKWLYKPIEGVGSAKDEVETLDRWISEKSDNPMYRYGVAQYSMFAFDPRVASGDLGNDPIKAMEYFKKNLKGAMPNIYEWYDEGDDDLMYRKLLYSFMGFYYSGKLQHVINLVGGVYMNGIKTDDNRVAYEPVPVELQKRAVKYAIAQSKDIQWIYPLKRSYNYEIGAEIAVMRKGILNSLLARMHRLNVSADKFKDVYTPEELVRDIYNEIWAGTIQGRRLSEEEIELQQTFLGAIAATSTLTSTPEVTEVKRNAPFFKGVVSGENEYAPIEEVAIPYGVSTYDVREMFRRSHLFKDVDVSAYYPMMESIHAGRPINTYIYYDLLMRTKELLEKSIPVSGGETKKHYEYMLFKIDKLLNK